LYIFGALGYFSLDGAEAKEIAEIIISKYGQQKAGKIAIKATQRLTDFREGRYRYALSPVNLDRILTLELLAAGSVDDIEISKDTP
jgi:hypothetical protein